MNCLKNCEKCKHWDRVTYTCDLYDSKIFPKTELYILINRTCDDETIGLIELNRYELYDFVSMVRDLNENAYYATMPIISIYPFSWNNLVEIDDENYNLIDPEGKNYVFPQNRIFYKNKMYTIKKLNESYWNYINKDSYDLVDNYEDEL